MTPPFSHIQIGPLSISMYGLIITSAIGLAYFLARRRTPLYHVQPELLDDLLAPLILLAIIGARLYHVIDLWPYYRFHPTDIVAIWHGGIGIYGAIAGGLIAIWWFCRQHHFSFLTITDLLTPSVLLGQAIGRWGNFFNQEAFGPPTNLPWKIYIDPSHRPSQWFLESYFQPLFLYESIWSLAGLFFSWQLTRRLIPYRGALFGFYLVWYGLGRFLIEQLRFDTATIVGIKTASLLSLVFLMSGIFLLVWSINSTRRKGYFPVK